MSFRGFLRTLPLFEGLTDEQLEQIRSFLKLGHYCAGETIFQQGDKAEKLFILLKGDVKIVFKPYDGPPLTVARITPGGIFGWSSALGREEYSSAAISISNTDIFYFLGENLESICDIKNDTGIIFLKKLAEAIAQRLKSTRKEIFNMLLQRTNCIDKEK
jgi:CRP/FNR family cyclic AMP-dependent transcriptional regulator